MSLRIRPRSAPPAPSAAGSLRRALSLSVVLSAGVPCLARSHILVLRGRSGKATSPVPAAMMRQDLLDLLGRRCDEDANSCADSASVNS